MPVSLPGSPIFSVPQKEAGTLSKPGVLQTEKGQQNLPLSSINPGALKQRLCWRLVLHLFSDDFIDGGRDGLMVAAWAGSPHPTGEHSRAVCTWRDPPEKLSCCCSVLSCFAQPGALAASFSIIQDIILGGGCALVPACFA